MSDLKANLKTEYKVPKINNRYICIIGSNQRSLAAVISSYLNEVGQYLPMFVFNNIIIGEKETDIELLEIHQVQKQRAVEFASRINNFIGKARGCEFIIYGGLSEEQKSYIKYSFRHKLIEVNTPEECEWYLSELTSRQDYIECNSHSLDYGLSSCILEKKLLRINDDLPDSNVELYQSEGCIFIERSEYITDIIGMNYAISIGMDFMVIDQPQITLGEIEDLIQEWKENAKDDSFNELSASIFPAIESIDFTRYKFATFFTDRTPYSLVLKNIIPITHVHNYLSTDFFILNNISEYYSNAFDTAVVFSPKYFKVDEETESVIRLLESHQIYVKELLGKNASNYELGKTIQLYPFSIFHICSHGGEISGFKAKSTFTDRLGTRHEVEYEEVVSFAPSRQEEKIEVTSKYFWKKFDGLIWKSKELKERNYDHIVFIDMVNQIPESRTVKRERKKIVHGSSSIACNDFPYQAMFNHLAGDYRYPFVFNNTCTSWSRISDSFINHGASTYIGTLWQIDNLTASETAESFYKLAFTSTILSSFNRSLNSTIGTKDENIYHVWGLHFSRLKAGHNILWNRIRTITFLYESLRDWKAYFHKINDESAGSSIKSFIIWLRYQLHQFTKQ